MRRARAFFLVCAGVLLLALSWHLGARNAKAQQEASTISGFTAATYGDTTFWVITPEGTVYRQNARTLGKQRAQYCGNFWVPDSGLGPQKSWGQFNQR